MRAVGRKAAATQREFLPARMASTWLFLGPAVVAAVA